MQRRGLRTLNIIKLKSLSFVVTIALAAAVVQASPDWPQWQGPDRTRMSKETGLLKQWPTGGPRVIWTTNNLGTGYGSMSVAGDRVFLQGARGPESVVIALNRADGKEVWAKALGPIDTRKTVWTAKELSDAAGYSSITVPDIQGVRTYMTFTATAPAAGCSI
jgi:hypothetical protein